jgi:AcrR family transcriptional regulator
MSNWDGLMVEHEKRRCEILEKALDVFVSEGFENATFQKIADLCGITRTILYTYFNNKKEIFNYSIKQFMETIEADVHSVQQDATLNSVDRLTSVFALIIARLEENRRLLLVIRDYLLLRDDANKLVKRRTIRMRHIFSSMIIDGIRTGELIPLNVREAGDLLYGLLELAIFRLTVLKRSEVGELKQISALCIRQLSVTMHHVVDSVVVKP